MGQVLATCGRLEESLHLDQQSSDNFPKEFLEGAGADCVRLNRIPVLTAQSNAKAGCINAKHLAEVKISHIGTGQAVVEARWSSIQTLGFIVRRLKETMDDHDPT